MSPWQIALIILLILVLFGAKRLPALGKSMGEALRNFKKGLDGQEESKSEDTDQKES
ncbi:MAG: twin-arginine translocase TatA/TatE family subunit [Bdellovibrionales bacterium]|nr:twin-arginine translocase TatA/TatE family subunit [Bdellovibrionales bacterium]